MHDLLQGVRVLELSLLAPDTCGGHLADLGADVIKLEQPPHGSPIRYMGTLHFRWNRGKKSVLLDLDTEQGRATFAELASTADVFIYGLRAGSASRFGVDYETLRQAKPNIVYCSLSGFGQEGPYRDMPTHGWAFDAISGLAAPVTGPDGLPRIPDAHTLVGIEAGGMFAALATVAALRKATETGESQYLDIAELDTALAYRATTLDALTNDIETYAMSGAVRYQYYGTADDEHVMLMALEDKFWRNFCQAVDREDLYEVGVDIDGPATTAGDRDKLRRELAQIFQGRTRAEWTALFIEQNIAGAPAYIGADVLDDPHVQSRDLTYHQEQFDGRTLELFGTPLKLQGARFSPSPAPAAGADTEAVLGLLRGGGA